MYDEMLEPLFSTEWGKRSGLGLLILMAFIFLYIFVQQLINWHADVVILRHSVTQKTTPSSGEDIVQQIAQIPQQHLFGNFQAIDTSAELPLTGLQLRLLGVIKAIPDEFSKVIISEANQPGKVYGIGESLPDGVTVYAIVADGVILENGGRLEKLPFLRQPLQFQGMPKPLLEKP